MDLADVTKLVETRTVPTSLSSAIPVYRSLYRINSETADADSKKRIFAAVSLDALIDKTVASSQTATRCKQNDFFFYETGWQSWGFGGETEPGKFQPHYVPLIPQFKKYVNMPGGKCRSVITEKSKLLIGQFIVYFRWQNTYVVVASTGNSHIAHHSLRTAQDQLLLPPVEYTIDRKRRILTCSVDAVGKTWKCNELIAELAFFSVNSFFELRAVIKRLFGTTSDARFSSLTFLSSDKTHLVPGGWESWYNHYSNINQNLIQADLGALGNTDNLIKQMYLNKKKPTVFQVDDGWEQGVGQWEADRKRFPAGMKTLASTISDQGYIPGLWIAPFALDYRTDFCTMHNDWLLKDCNGKPLSAGFNLTWGAFAGPMQPSLPYSFFCFDLSQEDVIEYLDSLMDKVVNEWGFRYIKLDFLYAGMLNGCFKNGGSAYQWYDRAIRILTSRKTNNKGEKVAYLGCGIPFEPSFNYLPLSRIGPDTKEAWDLALLRKLHFSGRPGAIVNMQSTLGHAFWDQSIFINDPDVVFLRNTNISLNDTEKELIALVNLLFASQIMHSDDPAQFDVETEGKLTNHLIGLYEQFADEEFGVVNKTGNVYLVFSKSRKYCGIINLSENEVTITTEELLAPMGSTSGEPILTPIVNHCMSVAQSTYSAQRHSISIFAL